MAAPFLLSKALRGVAVSPRSGHPSFRALPGPQVATHLSISAGQATEWRRLQDLSSVPGEGGGRWGEAVSVGAWPASPP